MANVHQFRPKNQSETEEVNLEIDDSQQVRQLSEDDANKPPILVLSRDAALVETVRKAAPRGVSVVQAPDLDHAAEKLPSLKPGVLVADTSSTADVASMVTQLTQHFPDLVVVIAGKKEDSAGLMQLTAAGRIFRFLLVPLTHGQTRLTLEAAVTQHHELLATSQRLGSSSSGDSSGGQKSYALAYVGLAAGLIVVIGGIWWFLGRGQSNTPVPAAQVVQKPGLPERPDPVKAEIALAKEAFNQGHYLEPAGDSALDLYRGALSIDPSSADAKAGIHSVADKVIEKAEAALVADKLEDAIKNIEMARDIEPTHSRLPFLDTQLSRERERIKLTQAQDVSNKVRSLLASANQRMQQGRLITPSGDSARDALNDARRLDPTNPDVAQSFRDLANLVVDEARKSVTAGKTEEAQTYVNVARQLGSAGAALTAVERSITEKTQATESRASAPSTSQAAAPAVKRSNPESDALAASVRKRMSDGQLIDPKGDSARDLLQKLTVLDAGRADIDDLSKQLSTRLLDVSKQAMAAKAFDRTQQLIQASRDVGARFNEAAISQAERDLAKARNDAAATNIISAAQIPRKRMVQPDYPESARKQGIEGWVEVVFTVTPKGTVEEAEVRNASPAGVFDESALKAIAQWRFEPVERDGQKVSQRAIVRLRFENNKK
jgi:TonB family protein